MRVSPINFLQTVLPLLPAVFLCIVAINQRHLVQQAHLTRWKGGGFGMFAVVDGLAERSVRFSAETPEGETRLYYSTETDAVKQFMSLPTAQNAQQLFDESAGNLYAVGLCQDCELINALHASHLHIDVWTLSFDADQSELASQLVVRHSFALGEIGD